MKFLNFNYFYLMIDLLPKVERFTRAVPNVVLIYLVSPRDVSEKKKK